MVSMTEYVRNALQCFHHLGPKKPQDQLHPHLATKYGAKKQCMEQEDTSPPLSKKDTKFVREVVGTFLYYARPINCTMLVALGSITT